MKFTAEGKMLVKKSLARLNDLPPMKLDSEGEWLEFKKEIYGLDCAILINRAKDKVQLLIEGELFDNGSPESENDEIEALNWFSTFEDGGMKTLVTVTELSVMYQQKSPEFTKYIQDA